MCGYVCVWHGWQGWQVARRGGRRRRSRAYIYMCIYKDKRAYLCIDVCGYVCLAWLAGGQAGREEVTSPRELRWLGPSETMQVSYKKSFVLTPFELWWASGLFGGLSGSQAGREEEEVTSVHIYACISGRLLDQFGFTSPMLCSRCCTS